MEAAAAAFALIGEIVQLVEQAQTASKEEHDAIVAGFTAARQALQDARTAAHAIRDTEAAATAAAVEAAKK